MHCCSAHVVLIDLHKKKMGNVFLFFCSLVAVSVVVEGLVNDHEQLEYRLAPKRYHRKIRSKLPEFAVKGREDFETSFELPPLISNFTLDESVAAAPSSSSAVNGSFLLDLPYPSHFLFSLQLLNLSLPFIGDGVQVPDDPPLPSVDIQDVLNNTQYFRHDATSQKTPSESKQALFLPDAGANPRPASTGRRSVNRIRNRIPAHLRHLPKRSVELNAPAESAGKGASIPARHWNASSSIQRRQEFHAKLRATTTPKPGLTKKLLYRRANSTAGKFNKLKAQIADRSSASAKPFPQNLSEQESASTQQYETSFTRPGLVISEPELKRTKMSGFVFTNERTSIRPAFTARPPAPSSGFVPFIPQHALQKEHAAASAESANKPFSSRLPQRAGNYNAKPLASNDFPRFEDKRHDDNGHQSAALSASEITQIQKPETFTVKIETSPASEDTATAASSTVLPIVDVSLNLTFPSFELPNADGSKAPPPTLPPPLSIEELIKKFTGSDPITDPPTVAASLPNTANQLSNSILFTPGRAISQTTNLTAPFNPELKPDERLQDSLKHLLTTAATGKSDGLLGAVSTQAPGTTEFKFQIPSPIKESATTDATPFLSQTFSFPITESPKSPSEVVTAKSTSENPVLVFPAAVNFGDISSTNSTTAPKNQSVSVQRGPLDVSSLDGSFGGSFPSAGVAQGGFQQGGFQQGAYQQDGFQSATQPGGFNFQSVGFQQQPSTQNFGGFQSGSLGPAEIAAGQQNPFYYATGGFQVGSGGQGQLQQGGYDGLLHYGPTGPPAGEYNAITQGLSLLASFGGGLPGGGQQFAIQQPASFQQGPTFGDFSTASLQSASQIQPTVNLPTQGFYTQGFPSFNIIQSQPQTSYQLVPSQQPSPYQVAQPQSYQQAGQTQQFQQVYSPSNGAQPSYQIVASGNPSPGGYPSTQFFQVQPQSAVFQSAGQAAQGGSAQLSINPAQFGTLLSGASTSAGETGTPAGTASVTSLSSSTSGETARSDKASSSSASEIIEVQLKTGAEQVAVADSAPAASEIVELIAIGPDSMNSESKSSKKSYFKRGLRSGYYS